MQRAATISFTVLIVLALANSAHAQEDDLEREKIARTTMKFLNISADPRAAAMGDAFTAMSEGPTSLFYNPAGMAFQETFLSAAVAQTQWFVDVKYNFASLSVRPRNGQFGVFGLSVVAADYGEIQETIRADTEAGFLDLGTFSPTALAVGLGYARTLTDRFAVGGHVRYAKQNLGSSVMTVQDGGYVRAENEEAVFAFDFGVRYATGFESLVFAVTARNFARKVEYAEESYELPLLLKIGVSMDLLDLTNLSSDLHSLVIGIDTESPRDYAEQVKIGGEYTFMNTISLRAGYIFPTDEQGINAGIGVHRTIAGIGIGADYAYTDFGIFSEVHRIGFQLSF